MILYYTIIYAVCLDSRPWGHQLIFPKGHLKSTENSCRPYNSSMKTSKYIIIKHIVNTYIIIITQIGQSYIL